VSGVDGDSSFDEQVTVLRSLAAPLVDFARVLRALPRVEWERLFRAPAVSMPRLRRLGLQSARRLPGDRAKLRRIVAFVDRCLPGGGNCYRRAMLESCLDAGAAGERLMLGLRASGGPRSGHAWLASAADADSDASYDAIVEM
jgi:hypothetical protein